MTLLEGLFDHQGRCLRAEAGKAAPIKVSISAKVIGTSPEVCRFRNSFNRSYFTEALPLEWLYLRYNSFCSQAKGAPVWRPALVLVSDLFGPQPLASTASI